MLPMDKNTEIRRRRRRRRKSCLYIYSVLIEIENEVENETENENENEIESGVRCRCSSSRQGGRGIRRLAVGGKLLEFLEFKQDRLEISGKLRIFYLRSWLESGDPS